MNKEQLILRVEQQGERLARIDSRGIDATTLPTAKKLAVDMLRTNAELLEQLRAEEAAREEEAMAQQKVVKDYGFCRTETTKTENSYNKKVVFQGTAGKVALGGIAASLIGVGVFALIRIGR